MQRIWFEWQKGRVWRMGRRIWEQGNRGTFFIWLGAENLLLNSASWQNIARKWRVSSIVDPSPSSYFWSPIHGWCCKLWWSEKLDGIRTNSRINNQNVVWWVGARRSLGTTFCGLVVTSYSTVYATTRKRSDFRKIWQKIWGNMRIYCWER